VFVCHKIFSATLLCSRCLLRLGAPAPPPPLVLPLNQWLNYSAITSSMDKGKWQNDREGLHFLLNIMPTEKCSNINCSSVLDPSRKVAGSQLWGTWSVIGGSGSQIRGAGSEIRRDPPQFNPCPEYTRGRMNTQNCDNSVLHILFTLTSSVPV